MLGVFAVVIGAFSGVFSEVFTVVASVYWGAFIVCYSNWLPYMICYNASVIVISSFYIIPITLLLSYFIKHSFLSNIILTV